MRESDYVGVEVSPGGVGLADKSDFPGAVPLFELALAGDGGFHGVVHFVPDEVVYRVSLGKSIDEVILVLPDALHKVGGDAYVDGTVWSAGEDVYARVLHTWGMVAHGWREGTGPCSPAGWIPDYSGMTGGVGLGLCYNSGHPPCSEVLVYGR